MDSSKGVVPMALVKLGGSETKQRPECQKETCRKGRGEELTDWERDR